MDSKANRSEQTTCDRAEGAEGKRGKRLDNIQREGREEKRTLTNSSELVCFYRNARNMVNKTDQFEAWVHDNNPDTIGVTESWSTSAVLDSELALGGRPVQEGQTRR